MSRAFYDINYKTYKFRIIELFAAGVLTTLGLSGPVLGNHVWNVHIYAGRSDAG